MHTHVLALIASLLLTACAVSQEQLQRQQQAEQDIEAILSQPAEQSDYVETKRCLRGSEYRDFRALDTRHLLFEGSRGRLWINRLSAPCPDLRHASVLRVRQWSGTRRICRLDTFQAGDWFDWPWYRRSPWRWGSGWGSKMTCSLGEFQAVTPAQVAALEAAIRSKYD